MYLQVYLALVGVFGIAVAILVSYGLASAIGQFYGPIHPILPFLLFGMYTGSCLPYPFTQPLHCDKQLMYFDQWEAFICFPSDECFVEFCTHGTSYFIERK